MSFMISRETENVGSSQEVINAFKALTEGGKRPYVSEAELYQVICTTLLVYCRYGLECNEIALQSAMKSHSQFSPHFYVFYFM